MEERGGGGLVQLPVCFLQSISSKLDVPSICSAARSCKLLSLCASHTLSIVDSFHLLDLPPTSEMLHHLLPPNLALKSLKVDCAQLGDSSIGHLSNPQLEELCLRCCDNITAELLFEIGRNCKNLRSLPLELGWLDEREDRPRTFIHNAGLEQLLRGCSQLERREATSLWNTDELRHHKPTHVDEARAEETRPLMNCEEALSRNLVICKAYIFDYYSVFNTIKGCYRMFHVPEPCDQLDGFQHYPVD